MTTDNPAYQECTCEPDAADILCPQHGAFAVVGPLDYEPDERE